MHLSQGELEKAVYDQAHCAGCAELTWDSGFRGTTVRVPNTEGYHAEADDSGEAGAGRATELHPSMGRAALQRAYWAVWEAQKSVQRARKEIYEATKGLPWGDVAIREGHDERDHGGPVPWGAVE